MLHVAELQDLLLKLLLHGDQFFSFLVELALHLVEIAIEHGDALLQIVYLLIFGKKVALVHLDIIQEDSFFIFTTTVVSHCLLQSLE